MLVRQMLGINGTGHGDLFKKDGEWYYVFHTHYSNRRVGPRKTAVLHLSHGSIDDWKIISETFEYIRTR
jgi:hypothetical protein